MSWVKIDDRYATHPKILRAGPIAMALDIAGMCYAAQHETDGHIPAQALGSIAPFLTRAKLTAAVATLCEVGRWAATGDGWQVHDFLVYNPSAAQRADARQREAERREAANERMQRHRKRKSDASPEASRNANVTPPPRPHPRPAEGGDGDPPKPPIPKPPSAAASPSSATPSGDADSAANPKPTPTSTFTDSGNPTQPNGQPLPAEARARLDELFGADWRHGPRQEANETQADFEAKRERFHAELDAFFAQNSNETETETEQS